MVAAANLVEVAALVVIFKTRGTKAYNESVERWNLRCRIVM
jgi:hypothetical protein